MISMTLQRSRTAPGQGRTAPGQTLAPRPAAPDGHGQLPLGVVRLSGLDGVRLPDDLNATSQTPWFDHLGDKASHRGRTEFGLWTVPIQFVPKATNQAHGLAVAKEGGPPAGTQRAADYPERLAHPRSGDGFREAVPGLGDDASGIRYRQVRFARPSRTAVDDLATTTAAITDADDLKPTSAMRMARRVLPGRGPTAGTMDPDLSRTEYFLETEFRGAARGT